MGEGSDAARAQVLAAREGAGRRARAPRGVRADGGRRPGQGPAQPGKAVGLAAGVGFLLVGGPKRVFRRAKRAVLGPPEPLPDVDAPQGDRQGHPGAGRRRREGPRHDRARVRGLPRADRAAAQEARLGAVGTILALTVIRRLFERYGQQLVDQLFSTDRAEFEEQLAKDPCRGRTASRADAAGDPAAARRRPPHLTDRRPGRAVDCGPLGRVAEWQTRRP